MPHREKKILVVEDTRAINNMIVSSLSQQLNNEVIPAYTMADAQKAVEKELKSFFLAILDLNLPDAPNGEIVDYILAKNIPCIVLTSNQNEEVQELILGKGAIDYINKANLNEVQYVIDTAMRLYHNFDRKVMVVEDSEVSLMVITSLLQKLNLNVIEAKNGVQALKLLKLHTDICLVVTDYNMPKMDGAELIQNIRREYTRDELSIIGISSTNDNRVSVKLLKSGANDFIARPFAHEEFNCRINQNIDANANYKKIKEATIKDFLTNLYNRKYIFETGEKLFRNAARDNINLTVAMLDIDHFKVINDTHGHHIGDLALKHISKLLNNSLREGDILARMGGEEFCILCINLDDNNASTLFDRIRENIMNTPLQVDSLTIPITISIGYSTTKTDSLEQMIMDADRALYKAKEDGRNKAISFSRTITSL